MSGHTPGPWRLDQGTCHTGAIATLHGEGKAWFEVWSRNWGQNRPGHTEANALLVCAAPDLLEAAERVVKYVGGNPDGDNYADTMSALAAAIRKARGAS